VSPYKVNAGGGGEGGGEGRLARAGWIEALEKSATTLGVPLKIYD